MKRTLHQYMAILSLLTIFSLDEVNYQPVKNAKNATSPRHTEALETREFRVSEVRANHQRTEHLIGLKPPYACYFPAFNHFFF